MCDRYNDFKHDPLSRCNCTPPYSAENAISARCDLNPAHGKYPFGALGHRLHGGADMKVRWDVLFDDCPVRLLELGLLHSNWGFFFVIHVCVCLSE